MRNARSYNPCWQPTMSGLGPSRMGRLTHPARLYLIDRRGGIREIYSISFFDERQAFFDIKTLLRESQ